ncbi:MAG: hypothetical protein GY950_26770 [bacterium]|nr:hypothetical protein [bacterium]
MATHPVFEIRFYDRLSPLIRLLFCNLLAGTADKANFASDDDSNDHPEVEISIQMMQVYPFKGSLCIIGRGMK